MYTRVIAVSLSWLCTELQATVSAQVCMCIYSVYKYALPRDVSIFQTCEYFSEI